MAEGLGTNPRMDLLELLSPMCPPGRNRGLTLLCVHRRDLTQHTLRYTHTDT